MSSELLVPSASCDYRCDETKHHYNSSLSSTYLANGSYSNVRWALINYSGYLSRDVVRIGSVKTADQMFEEWTSAKAYLVGAWEYGYDGIIGLAPPWRPQVGSYMPNTLSGLLPQLDAPIFSLKLPTKEGDQGELLLGATNRDLYVSEPITVPLVDDSHNFMPYSWTLPAEAITFDSQVPLQTNCGSPEWAPGPCHAVIDSSTPYIMLPHALAVNITAAVGARRGPLWFYNIPCERRQELPTLTVTLGGHNFSISAFEYTLEVEIPHQGVTCLVSIMDESHFTLPRHWNGILLGNPFIRRFYSVFDMEKREIGCKCAHSFYNSCIMLWG
jgi:saccharopepsin